MTENKFDINEYFRTQKEEIARRKGRTKKRKRMVEVVPNPSGGVTKVPPKNPFGDGLGRSAEDAASGGKRTDMDPRIDNRPVGKKPGGK